MRYKRQFASQYALLVYTCSITQGISMTSPVYQLGCLHHHSGSCSSFKHTVILYKCNFCHTTSKLVIYLGMSRIQIGG